MKAGTVIDAILTSGVLSPLDDERRSIAVTYFPLPQTNENRLNHGQNLKIVNLKDQASHEFGNVSFKITKNTPIMVAVLLKVQTLCSFFPNYAKNYASTIDKGLLLSLICHKQEDQR